MASISSNESSVSEASDPRSLGEVWFNLMDKGHDAGSNWAMAPAGSVLSDGNLRNNKPLFLEVASSPQRVIQQGGDRYPRMERIQQHQQQSSVQSSLTSSGSGKHAASATCTGSRGRDSLSEDSDKKSSKRRKRSLSESKRVERNAREQARSNRLSEQFADLRDLLVKAGIVVPKGTKGSVLAIVGDYIRVLEQKRITTEA
jgi:Helix-loop-helix DNA-binding domain